MTHAERMEIAKKIADKTQGRAWTPPNATDNSPVRVYLRKGYVLVDTDGEIDVDNVGGHLMRNVRLVARELMIASYRGYKDCSREEVAND